MRVKSDPFSLRGAQRRGNLDEAEHTSTNRHCYGDEIANPRIEYGVAMRKWVRVRGPFTLTVRGLPWAADNHSAPLRIDRF